MHGSVVFRFWFAPALHPSSKCSGTPAFRSLSRDTTSLARSSLPPFSATCNHSCDRINHTAFYCWDLAATEAGQFYLQLSALDAISGLELITRTTLATPPFVDGTRIDIRLSHLLQRHQTPLGCIRRLRGPTCDWSLTPRGPLDFTSACSELQ